MNVYDSGRMTDLLLPLGYSETSSPDDADLVILNTCHIREKAAEKVYSELGRLGQARQVRRNHGKDMMVAVAGCVAQAEGDEIKRRAPIVDIVVGPQTYHRLPELIARAHRARGLRIDTEFPADSKFDSLPENRRPRGPSAFLTIQEGCDKFCTFCVVPYTRGAESSRPAADILREADELVDSGAREVVLLGQNVNAWRGQGTDGTRWSLARLIEEVAAATGVERIRYTTSHPRDMSDDLINVHGSVPRLMPYLHLPVQSGSNAVLRAMNRRHTAESYLAIIEKLRNVRPDMAISGDFIVGFPGETDADFAETISLVRMVGYASAFSFKYSPRPGTPAASAARQVDEDVKNDRLQTLQQLLNSQRHAFNHASIGSTVDVLFERPGRYQNQFVGRTPHLQPVHVTSSTSLIGDVAPVTLIDALPNSMAGVLAGTGCENAQRKSLESIAA